MASRDPAYPNILFILTDDQGAWAMGCAGNDEIRTPNLDSLAAAGTRFDNFFCASPVCSPARATILTGRIPSSHGIHDWIRRGNLPPIDPQYGKPVLGAGDIYAMFNDRPEVRAVIQYFSMGESLKGWVEAGGAIAVQKDASLDWYGDVVTRKVAEMIQNATAFRFDASDLMPGAVGAGSFWKSMTDYVSGSIDLDTALKQIDESWPK